MSLLLKEIQHIDRRAADELKQAGLDTDSDIQALTREELVELFPGAKNLKLRRTIFDAIHKQRPVELLLKKLKGFIPSESFRAALTDNGVLVDYLGILKDMKTQTNNVQSFLEAHISLLEESSKNQPDQGSANCSPVKRHTDGCPPEPQKSSPSPSTSFTGDPVDLRGRQSYARPGGAYGSGTSDVGDQVNIGGHFPGTQRESSIVLSPRDCVEPTLYKMVVSGKTFDTHLKLMEKVKKSVQNQIQHCEGSQDNKITFVFCPISSRIASDVEAAMTDVKDDKPVILVLMHHSREAKTITSMRTWSDDARVVLHVNVFYHETIGLVTSVRNDAAVTEIQNKLVECFIPRSKDTSGNAQGVGTDHRSADHRSADHRGADHRGAGHMSNSSWYNLFSGSRKQL